MSGILTAFLAVSVPDKDFGSQLVKERLLKTVEAVVAQFDGIRVLRRDAFACTLTLHGSEDELSRLDSRLHREELGALGVDDLRNPAIGAAVERY